MKNKTSNSQIFKLLASHTLVIAAFTSPYFTGIFIDFIKILINDMSDVAPNHSATIIMGSLSSVALFISITSFIVYVLRKNK